jgi:hypothetical protein
MNARPQLAVLALLASATAVNAAPVRPLVQGKYELLRIKPHDGDEVSAASVVTRKHVWARMTMAFDGSKVSYGTETLTLEGGHYSACQATVTTEVEWTPAGFKVAATVEGGADTTAFRVLTAKKSKLDTSGCSISLNAGTYAVNVTADGWNMRDADGNVLHFGKTPDIDETEWRDHVGHP